MPFLVPASVSTPRTPLLTALTPARCILLLVALIAFDVISRFLYLRSPDALPLAPDEAQYWVWSRQPDWSYYSKPGMAAWLIAASTSIFGHTMLAVRVPAILLGAGNLTLTFLLTWKLFSSPRLALGAALLTHAVPMYLAGSMLMTIDAPFCFCWALATTLFVFALVSDAKPTRQKLLFFATGVAVGLGFLAKYTSLLFLLGALAALFLPSYRRHLRTPWPWLMALTAGLFTLPILRWNLTNHWVSARHVKADVADGFSPFEPLVFLAGTVAAVGPFLFPLILSALLRTFRPHPKPRDVHRVTGVPPVQKLNAETSSTVSRRTTSDVGVPPALASYPTSGFPTAMAQSPLPAQALALTALPYLAIVTASCLFTTAKINWSAPAWFALLILTAANLRQPSRIARVLLPCSIVLALILSPLAHDTRFLYPAVARLQTSLLGYATPNVRRVDPTARLRGWPTLAAEAHKQIPVGGFVLADTYADAAELEFSLPGQPPTYVLGSYLDTARYRGRMSQWDLWPERSLEPSNPLLLGRDALFIGPPRSELTRAFDSVTELPPVTTTVTAGGQTFPIDTYRLWLCKNFRGLPRPTDGANHY